MLSISLQRDKYYKIWTTCMNKSILYVSLILSIVSALDALCRRLICSAKTCWQVGSKPNIIYNFRIFMKNPNGALPPAKVGDNWNLYGMEWNICYCINQPYCCLRRVLGVLCNELQSALHSNFILSNIAYCCSLCAL